jgi:hypothetical protein
MPDRMSRYGLSCRAALPGFNSRENERAVSVRGGRVFLTWLVLKRGGGL